MLIAFHRYDKIIKIVKTTSKKYKKVKLILSMNLRIEKETEKLRFEHEVGIPIDKIAKNHGRKKGAVRSRLKKEGLIEE